MSFFDLHQHTEGISQGKFNTGSTSL